jgi:hypothetical protein
MNKSFEDHKFQTLQQLQDCIEACFNLSKFELDTKFKCVLNTVKMLHEKNFSIEGQVSNGFGDIIVICSNLSLKIRFLSDLGQWFCEIKDVRKMKHWIDINDYIAFSSDKKTKNLEIMSICKWLTNNLNKIFNSFNNVDWVKELMRNCTHQ